MSARPDPAATEGAELSAESPWPGLAPYTSEQAAYFHGRSREVEQLFRLVRLNPLTVLYAQSGLGKTSLLQAALFPSLAAEGFLAVPIRLDYSRTAPPPREQIGDRLAAALHGAGVPAPGRREDETLWEYFHHHANRLRGPAPDGQPLVPVLCFDQFEELFTLGAERSDSRSFVREGVQELAALIENHPPDRVEARFAREPALVGQFDFDRQDYRVLFSLREDYLAHLHELSQRIPSVTLNNLRLAPLQGDRALEVVVKPGGRLVTPEVAEGIVRFVAGAGEARRPGEGSRGEGDSGSRRAPSLTEPIEALVVDPSLLCLFCRELNQKRRAAGLPAITGGLVADSSENILTEFYERCFAGLPEAARAAIEDELLTPTGYRETVARDSLSAALERAGVSPGVIDLLVRRRLLHYEQRGRDRRVELTHDVLAPVASRSRTVRREREALAQAEAARRHELEENERRAQAARQAAEARLERARRERRIVLAAVVLLALATGAAALQWQRAERQAAALRDSTAAANRARAVSDSLQRVTESAFTQTASAFHVSDSLRSVAEGALAKEQSATQRATRARQVADSARQVATERLEDLCRYSRRLATQLADSTLAGTASERLYAALATISDEYTEQMRAKDPGALCPLQLQTRFEAIGARALLTQSQEFDGGQREQVRQQAREHALDGLRALTELDRYDDQESRDIAVDASFKLASVLRSLGMLDSVERAVRTGIRAAEGLDPGRDSKAYYRNALLHHQQGVTFTSRARFDSARAALSRGLAVVRTGQGRPDQNREYLFWVEERLHLALARADSAQQRSAEAVAHAREALHAAEAQYAVVKSSSNYEDIALAYELLGNFRWFAAEYPEARTAYDSAEVYRARLAAELSGGVSAGNRETARQDLYLLRQRLFNVERQPAGELHRALRWANRIVNVTESLAAPTLASMQRRVRLSVAYDTLASLQRAVADHRAAVESYRREITIDSAIAAASRMHPDTLVWLARSYENAAEAADAARLRAEAVRFQTSAVRTRRSVLDRLGRDGSAGRQTPMAARSQLAVALGNLSWYDLRNGEAADAVTHAREGITLDSTQVYIYTNLISGLLLSGRADSAEHWFRQKGQVTYAGGRRRIGAQVLVDLAELLAAGVARQADIDRVKAWDIP